MAGVLTPIEGSIPGWLQNGFEVSTVEMDRVSKLMVQLPSFKGAKRANYLSWLFTSWIVTEILSYIPYQGSEAMTSIRDSLVGLIAAKVTLCKSYFSLHL